MLSLQALVDVRDVGQIREVAKGGILVGEGEFSFELFYVAKGGARAYNKKKAKQFSMGLPLKTILSPRLLVFFFAYLANIQLKYWKTAPSWCGNFKILKCSWVFLF